ncbi:MAG: LysM peptidoglycan-binding domain-containing protein [Planctomycetota bacterium]
MGTFEKLGILVIVVIIVMIMAVAIYQWGGAGEEAEFGPVPVTTVDPDAAPPFVRDYVAPAGAGDPAPGAPKPLAIPGGAAEAGPAGPAGSRRRGVPAVYEVQPGDILWKVVFQRWRLQESFLARIQKANPGVNLASLRPGMRLRIPDPEGFFRSTKPGGTPRAASYRTYRVQEGDDLWTISRKHLGSALRYKQILSLNPGLSPLRLRPGQVIRLPAR